VELIRKNIQVIAIALTALVYYLFLCCKDYTWIFASGDSGDWLAAANMWLVVQPYGSPLYILLARAISFLPFSLPAAMTILLSVIPSVITVVFVYLITVKISGKKILGITASVVLLGSAVFLSQSTILEEYALAVMFVVLAYWFYLKDKKVLTALMLGLGTAVHIVPLAIAGLWMLLHIKQIRTWIKPLLVFVASGILPYSLTLYLLAGAGYPFLGGYGLSLEAIRSYIATTGVFGSLTIFQFPDRVIDFTAIMLTSFGIALVPAIAFFKKRPWEMWQKLIFIVIFFSLWYYLTCLDPTAWTFVSYASPFIAIAAALGISKLNKPGLTQLVVVGAITLMLLNSIAFNAAILNKQSPIATDYYNNIMALPDGSALVLNRGGFESMAVMYAISEGKNITPIFFTGYGYKNNASYINYSKWANDVLGLEGFTTQELANSALLQGKEVYIIHDYMDKWNAAFITTETNNPEFRKILFANTDVEVHNEDNRFIEK
jgi:hypothetical protein